MAVPSDISGLLAWYKADAITGKVDNDSITQWDDSSGNARHATGTGPTYQTNELNGLPVVRFDGVDDNLATAVYSQPAQWTAFAVANRTGTPTTGGVLIGADNTTGQYVRFGASTAEAIAFPGPTTDTQTTTAANLQIISTRRDATTVQVWVDGTSGGSTGTSGSPAGPTSETLGVGGYFVSEVLNGNIAEAFMYDTALSTGDRQSMEAYLVAKWFTAPVVEIVLPDADITTTGWTTTPLFSKVNDDSDGTVITGVLA